MRKLLLPLAAAAFAGGVSSQQIVVTNNGGWFVTPGVQQVINNFSSSNGAGFIMGGASGDVGTSISATFTYAAASVQGILQNPGSIADGRTSSASATEFYAKLAGGLVTVNLTATPLTAIRNLRGNGYLARTNARVIVTCPLFTGSLRANTSTIADPSSILAVIATIPQSASASANLTGFSVTMQAIASATGSMTNVGDAIQLFSGATAFGSVTLN